MLSALIRSRRRYPAVHLAAQPVDQRSVQHGPLVLVSEPRKFHTPTIDRDRTVSRRSEPSSRATLMGEQPNPWDLLQPQDVTSRHRGAKPLRRYELLGGISLLSPEYLLSFERCPFHTETPDHYALVSYLIDLSVSPVKRPYAITLYGRLPIGLRAPLEASVTLLEATTPVKLPTKQCPQPEVRTQTNEGSYFNGGSTMTGVTASKPPTYPTHRGPNPMLSYSKGSRGLFVPSRVIGIFTDTTISLGSRLRQCPDHYTIRAGRNLPDKEFRYFRTVIVMGRRLRGFNSMLPLR